LDGKLTAITDSSFSKAPGAGYGKGVLMAGASANKLGGKSRALSRGKRGAGGEIESVSVSESSLRHKQQNLVDLMQQLQGKLELRDAKIMELKGQYQDDYETGDEYL
jgi:hypothetical protein